MAKFEDYARKHAQTKTDDLDNEIDDALLEEDVREQKVLDNTFAVPERFKGKSAEDIAKAYEELEKLNSRQAQDLGSMRKLVDQLISSEADNQPEPTPSDEPVNFDSLYDDPESAISKVVARHPAVRKLNEIEQDWETQKRQTAQEQFASKHPDYQNLIQEPAFANWVQESSTRLDLLRRADQWDFSAADALFTLYKAETSARRSEASSKRNRTLNQATLEASVADESPAPRTFSRQEWLNQLTRSKQGDPAAEEYIRRNAAAYRKALGSGNVRD